MSRRSSDSALVVDLEGVLRIWDPEIVSSAERRAGLPPGALDRAASADATTLRAVVTGRIRAHVAASGLLRLADRWRQGRRAGNSP